MLWRVLSHMASCVACEQPMRLQQQLVINSSSIDALLWPGPSERSLCSMAVATSQKLPNLPRPFVMCCVQPPHKRQPWEMARITPSPPPSPVPTGPKVQFGAMRAMLEDFVRAGNTQLAMLRALDR